MERVFKITVSIVIGLIFIAVIAWAIMQKPIEIGGQEDNPAGYYQPPPFQGPV